MNCDRCGSKITSTAGCLCSSPANGYSAPDWPQALADRDAEIARLTARVGELDGLALDIIADRDRLTARVEEALAILRDARRSDLVSCIRMGEPWQEMEPTQGGEWVESVDVDRALAPIHPIHAGDLCGD